MRKIHLLTMGLVVYWVASVIPVVVAASPLDIKGVVVNAEDRPVADAGVVVLGARTDGFLGMRIELLAESKTDADGTFDIHLADAPDCERVLVAARHEGLAIGSWNGAKDDVPASVVLKMGVFQMILGEVTDASGKPVAGAVVKAMMSWQADGHDYALLGHPAIPELMAKTDDAGRFAILAVPEGAKACLVVEADGYAGTVWPDMTPSVPAGASDLAITLSPGASVSGKLTCADAGQSLEGLTVVASYNALSFLTDCKAKTDTDGRFTLSGLPMGEVRLSVATGDTSLPAEGVTESDALPWVGETEVVVASADTQPGEVVIALQQTAVVEVTVQSLNSHEVISDAQVTLHDSSRERYWNKTTNEQGVARLLTPPGQFMAYANHPDYTPSHNRQYVGVEPGQTQGVSIGLTQAAFISGTVVGTDGQPVAGAQVLVMPGRGQGPTDTDSQGHFRLKWEPVEWGMDITSMLVVRDLDTQCAAALPIEDPAQPMNVTLQPGSVFTGRVLDEQGRPLADANITVSIQGDRWGSSLPETDPVKTDDEGRFRVSSLPPEAGYSLTASANGFGQHTWRVDYAGSTETVLDDATLLKADQKIAGVVVDEQGKPVANVHIQAYGEEQPHQTTQSDAEGKFTMDGLCKGYVNLYANTRSQPHMYGQMMGQVGRSDVKIVVAAQGSYNEPPVEPTPQPIKGQAIPDLSTLGLDAAPAGRPVLVLFIDARQRPSRHAAEQLQAQAGASTSAHVVLVQLGEVESALLDGLGVTLPMARVSKDVDQCRMTWGVPGLPWYVLADPSGKVVHSGPSLKPAP